MSTQSATFRIGTGAGFSADRLDPAVDLARQGKLDVMIIECLGERTLAFAHRDRKLDPRKGYNAWLERRMRALLPPCRAAGTLIITNMGAANPRAAAEATIAIARELGLADLKVACVEGDEVTDLLAPDTPLMDEPGTLRDVNLPMVGANAYLGADALLPALQVGADVVIGGRIADPSLVVAPLAQKFGWALDEWQRLGAGTLVGHLLECGMQVTGGYFADPGKKDVSNLASCGFPIAEVEADGRAVITKLPQAGGCVTTATVKEQLLYEVHDPRCYLTPDVSADFSRVAVREAGIDRVQVTQASGRCRPERLKVTVGFEGGFLAEAGLSYAGPSAQNRARLAAEIVEERMRNVHSVQGAIRIDIVGVNSLFASAGERPTDTEDVRLHVALRSANRENAELMLWEVESLLCCGPAGGGGFRGTIVPSVVTRSVLIERERVQPRIDMLVA
jgi:hypothetical protein